MPRGHSRLPWLRWVCLATGGGPLAQRAVPRPRAALGEAPGRTV